MLPSLATFFIAMALLIVFISADLPLKAAGPILGVRLPTGEHERSAIRFNCN